MTSTGQIIDQYWSHHPLLGVRCDEYVYGGMCVVLCAGLLGAELVVFSGERMGMRGYFFSPLMREGFCLTKSAQFFVAPAEAERRGEEVRKWWQRAAARPSVASSSRGI